MVDVVVFGALAASEVATVYLEAHSEHRVVGFTVDAAYRRGDEFLGRPLVDWETLEQRYPPDQVRLFGPISYRRMNQLRRDRYHEGKARGYGFISFVHPSVETLGVQIGDNCFICGGVLIEPCTRIGDNVMIWSRAHIGHHSVIGDHCFIGPDVGIGGSCTIGEMSFFGPKADVMSGVHVGRDCFFGARAAIRENAADGSVFPGGEVTPKAAYGSDRLVRHV
jgi:sugar O-acyltransferase (sialic acid O-acetyltransferase NeuD family)